MTPDDVLRFVGGDDGRTVAVCLTARFPRFTRPGDGPEAGKLVAVAMPDFAQWMTLPAQRPDLASALRPLPPEPKTWADVGDGVERHAVLAARRELAAYVARCVSEGLLRELAAHYDAPEPE